ncbi:MAG TPA: HAD hydrolase-like protein [Verrucomicrobiae bacterium]|jgi:phosphoglycolate phosphatase-like HAD superfamily hydrolase
MFIFDVDGTLITGESTDWACFRGAFEEVAGFFLSDSFFESIEEITAQAIIHQALPDLPLEERRLKERSVCEGFLRRLKEAHNNAPHSFKAVEGAAALIQELKEKGIPIAIATGDWRETISFKLSAGGLSFDGIPMVTSSEFFSRSEIIAAAAAKAGGPIEKAIYVGDGPWDLRACRKLGIRFIGVGHRREKLRIAGAAHHVDDLSPLEFWRIKEMLDSPQILRSCS